MKQGQRSRSRVQTIAAYAAALFVGEVKDVQGGVKTKVALVQKFFQLRLGRSVRGETAGVFVELELKYGIGSVASDVRHEGVAIGRIGLHRMGPWRRGQPFDGWPAHRSVIRNCIYRRMCALVIGRQHEPAFAVRVDIDRPRLKRYRPILRESSIVAWLI